MFYTVYNTYNHGTEAGSFIGTLRGYELTMGEEGNRWYGMGYTFKQLMRQGVMSKKHPWRIKYCRNAFRTKNSSNIRM